MAFFLNSFNYAVIVPSVGTGFSILIDTTKAGTTTNTQFNLALAPSTSYDFNIDWGDNVKQSYTSSNTTGYTHTYPVAGKYLISIEERTVGGFPRVYYNNSGDKLKLLNITQFGGNQFGNNWSNAFYGCTNLQISAIDFATAKTQNITNFGGAWLNCTSLNAFPLIDTSKVTNFYQTWYNCSSLSSFPLIDTSKGTNFGLTWAFCTSLTAFPLIDTSKGTDFYQTWNNCNKLIDFPAINTLSGTNFSNTWGDCTLLTAFPLIDTSKGIIFNSTWYNCNKLIDFPAINTLSGTDFGGTWYNCTSLTAFPLIDTSKGISFNNTWYNCTSLTAFPLIDTSKGTNFSSTWYNCSSLSASEFPTLNMSKMTAGGDCFKGVKLQTTSYSSLLTSLCATNFNTGVIFHGGNSTFNTPGSAAKVFLTKSIVNGGRGWTIFDGGYQAGT